jgi:hypothetical protein
MKKFAIILVCLTAALILIRSTSAQTAVSRWPFFMEVTAGSGTPGFYSLTLPPQVFDKARDDLADLRLWDAKGNEIPYALWIRKEVDEQQEVTGRLFNQVTKGTAASEVSVDLGAEGIEHNEVEIETGGTNFRRRVEIEGSDNATDWKSLKSDQVIFSFESQNRSVQSNRVNYPTSRYRYLRVRVFADELSDKRAPVIANVRAIAARREEGERVSWALAAPDIELLRYQGVPASAWTLDLGARAPCDRLQVEVNADSFSRPFQVEAFDDPENVRLIASGELTRRVGEERKPLLIPFDREENLRKLRLVVTDYSNQTLPISSFAAEAPARQLVFELRDPSNGPLRLFFGNPKATPTHYDFEKELSARLKTTPFRSDAGAAIANPEFKPEPLPLTERVPWLIYVVLFASSVALALVLLSLARATRRMAPTSSGPPGVETERV